MNIQEKTYNGWKNYETWNVKLWMDNDESEYDFWLDEAESAWKACGSDKDEFCSTFAGILKDHFNDNMPDLSGCYADLLGAALSEVDWYEIAESFVEHMPMEDEE